MKLRIDHKEFYKDFGNQFVVDSKLNDHWGSRAMLKDIVKPFNLNEIKKNLHGCRKWEWKKFKNFIKFKPKKFIQLNYLKQSIQQK